MAESVYIHIPFCKSKCKYCSFVSYVSKDFINEYISALIKELKHYYKGGKLKTLYFGGGTPSLLDVQSVDKIISLFNFSTDCEITFELNPDDASKEYIKSLRNIGINRLSIGSQTFNDNILKYIGRRHDSKQIITAVDYAIKADFENISLDLIYGLPFQTPNILKKDLETITSLGIQHISTYGLKIEQPSYFSEHIPESLPDDDMQASMYEIINSCLPPKGFERYEISNFSKKGFESKHNLTYWNNDEYYGFGAAAHGYIDGIRYSNSGDLVTYISKPYERLYQHAVTKQEKLEEEIFLGLRKTNGININKINNYFKIDFDKKYGNIISKYQGKYIKRTPEGYAFTLQGVLLSNIILADFID